MRVSAKRLKAAIKTLRQGALVTRPFLGEDSLVHEVFAGVQTLCGCIIDSFDGPYLNGRYLEEGATVTCLGCLAVQ